MAGYTLQLFTDRLAPGGTLALPAGAVRVLYVAEGGASIAAADTVACLAANSAWHGATAAALTAGAQGARVLRYELVAGGTARDGEATLAAAVTLDAAGNYLMRCDRVEFPPGGVAYTHTHQGPGIRCLQQGKIRIDTAGASHTHAPGEAWFESGPDPVFAAGAADADTAFVRVMILPSIYLGRSSIRYMLAEDQDKPKRQSYQIFIDAALALPGAPA